MKTRPTRRRRSSGRPCTSARRCNHGGSDLPLERYEHPEPLVRIHPASRDLLLVSQGVHRVRSQQTNGTTARMTTIIVPRVLNQLRDGTTAITAAVTATIVTTNETLASGSTMATTTNGKSVLTSGNTTLAIGGDVYKGPLLRDAHPVVVCRLVS